MNIFYQLITIVIIADGTVGIIVDIPGQGKVEGIETPTEGPKNTMMYRFLGIPYGKDTSGANRFMASEFPGARPSDDILNVTTATKQDACPQLSRKPKQYVGTEDCLKLHIYTPSQLPTDDPFSGPYPVLVMLHAGFYTSGVFEDYAGDRLLNDNDIVYVVPHFRLGVLGYLCTHHENYTCNAGLHDQLLALQWIHQYISYFGGDPDKIVVGGVGAGAQDATHLMLSTQGRPMIKGLLLDQLTPLQKYVLSDTPVKSALDMGKLVGCDYSESKLSEFMECMKDVPAEDLVNKLQDWKDSISNYPFESDLDQIKPTIEEVGTNKIITSKPKKALKNGDFTGMVTFAGCNLNAGSSSFARFYKLYIEPNNYQNNETFWKTDAMKWLLQKNTSNNALESDLVDYFFNGVYPTNMDNAMSPMIDAISTLKCKEGMHKFSKYIKTRGGTAYVFSFDYKGGESKSIFDKYPIYAGVNNGDELQYVFPGNSPLTDPKDIEMSNITTNLWKEFAKNLNPTQHGPITLPGYTGTKRKYLSIDSVISVKTDYKDTYRACMGPDGTEDKCAYVET